MTKGTLDEEKEPTDDNECKLIFLQGQAVGSLIPDPNKITCLTG